MAKFTVKIDNILGGWSPSVYLGGANQFDSSIGIDPDMPISDNDVKPSGGLRPTCMTKFSGNAISGAVLHILTNPKDTKVYTYNSDGEVISYDSNLSSETVVGTPTSGAGNGAEYYDNYNYFATPTNISRHGPLNGVASLTNSYWTSTLSKTALNNTSYPSILGITIPNHPMKYHKGRNRLYFGDVVSGKGVIHYISTTKTTVEGDTDNGSTYNALDLRYGYYPTCLEEMDTDLVIGSIQATNNSILQKSCVITFWDTTSTTPSKIIEKEIPYPLITALRNINGVLYAFVGTYAGGTAILRFLGGYSWKEVASLDEVLPPFSNAVDSWLNRIVIGGSTTYPEVSGSVFAIGSKKLVLSSGDPIHNILRTTSAGTSPIVTALKYVRVSNPSILQPIVAWKDGSGYGIDKVDVNGGGSTNANVFRSQIFRIGEPFSIDAIRIPLAQPVDSGTVITVKIYVDDFQNSFTLGVINDTNYPNSETNISHRVTGVSGQHNFLIELRWTGDSLNTVSLPITIKGSINSDSTK